MSAPDIRTRANERSRRRVAAADARHPLGEIDSREVRAIAVGAALDVAADELRARAVAAENAADNTNGALGGPLLWTRADTFRNAAAHLLTQGDEK